MQSGTWDALEAFVSKANSIYEVPVSDGFCGSHIQPGLLLVTFAASMLALFWARAAAEGREERLAVQGRVHGDTAPTSERFAVVPSAPSPLRMETPAETVARLHHHCHGAGCRDWDCSCECAGCCRASR